MKKRGGVPLALNLAVAFFVTPYYNDYIAIMYCKVVIFLFRFLVLQDSNLASFFA